MGAVCDYLALPKLTPEAYLAIPTGEHVRRIQLRRAAWESVIDVPKWDRPGLSLSEMARINFKAFPEGVF